MLVRTTGPPLARGLGRLRLLLGAGFLGGGLPIRLALLLGGLVLGGWRRLCLSRALGAGFRLAGLSILAAGAAGLLGVFLLVPEDLLDGVTRIRAAVDRLAGWLAWGRCIRLIRTRGLVGSRRFLAGSGRLRCGVGLVLLASRRLRGLLVLLPGLLIDGTLFGAGLFRTAPGLGRTLVGRACLVLGAIAGSALLGPLRF